MVFPPDSLLSLKRLPAPGADNDVRLMKTGLREFMQRYLARPGLFRGCPCFLAVACVKLQ